MSNERALPGPVPAFRPQIPKDDVQEIQRRLDRTEVERDRYKAELEQAKKEIELFQRVIGRLRHPLEPFHQLLKFIMGETDVLNLPDVPAPQTHFNSGAASAPSSGGHYSPRMTAALERLSGVNHKILKAIIDVGPITQVALSKMIGCAEGTASNTCSHLKSLGFIRQNEQKRWEMKE